MKAVIAVVAGFVVLVAMTRPPTLYMTLKPDPNDRQKMGIGLALKGPFGQKFYGKDGRPLKATIKIKTKDGTVVGEETDLLRSFAFG